MSQESEMVLRRSLDAVDGYRRRLFWLLAIVSGTVAWEFYRLFDVRTTGNVPEMIVAAVIVLSFWTLGLAVLLVFQLTVATRRILRAIDLVSRPAE